MERGRRPPFQTVNIPPKSISQGYVPLPAKVPLLLPAHKTAEHLQFKVLSKEALKKEHLKQCITMIY